MRRTKTPRHVQGLLLLALLTWSGQSLAATYYLSAEGDDTATGTEAATPWRGLDKLRDIPLGPGDRVLLHAGHKFTGSLTLTPTGSEDAPVIIGSYGGDDRPLIDGNGAEAAIHLVNPSFVTVQDLELTNKAGHYGVRLTAQDAGELGTVTLRGLDIHDVYETAWSAGIEPGHDQRKYYSGINVQAERGETPSWWSAIVIADNTIHDLGTCGISIGSAYPLHEQLRNRRRRRGGAAGDTSPREPYPIRGVHIVGNVIRDIARDGAIVRQCYGAIMEYNTVARTGGESISNGLWFWDCEASVIRYNEGYECRVQRGVDGGPFSIDYNCKDCRIEYNYSHDNQGPGFMAFGNNNTGTGTIIRGNLSINDNTAEMEPGFAAVSMISTLSETIVAENIVIAGPDTKRLLGHHDWQGLPRDVTYEANVFVGNGSAVVEPSVLDAGFFEGNLFVNVPDLPEAISVPDEKAADWYLRTLSRMHETKQDAGVR